VVLLPVCREQDVAHPGDPERTELRLEAAADRPVEVVLTAAARPPLIAPGFEPPIEVIMST